MDDRNKWAPLAFWVPFSVLAVLLAVALLAAVLPSLIPGGQPPQRISCTSNLHQLGLVFASYTSDWDDKFPISDNWPQVTEMYCKSRGIYTCPKSSPGSGMRLKIREYEPKVHITYSMNARIKGLSIHDVDRPEDTVLLFDSTGARLAGGPELLPKEVRHEQESLPFVPQTVINVLFADGHVKQIPIDDVPNLKWDPK